MGQRSEGAGRGVTSERKRGGSEETQAVNVRSQSGAWGPEGRLVMGQGGHRKSHSQGVTVRKRSCRVENEQPTPLHVSSSAFNHDFLLRGILHFHTPSLSQRPLSQFLPNRAGGIWETWFYLNGHRTNQSCFCTWPCLFHHAFHRRTCVCTHM
jgi:hypothetical protein